jgi:glycosyltransferase involved in cell wall biosynthesis
MIKIFVIGHFSSNKIDYGGQTIKTKNVLKGLLENFPKKQISTFDYSNIKFYNFFLFLKFFYFIIFSKYIVVLPGKNALFFLLKFIFRFSLLSKKTHYITIGGWLPNFIQNKPYTKKSLMKLSKIYLETESIYNKMLDFGFSNVEIMTNFKYLEPVNLVKDQNIDKFFTLCTFSRVTKSKGILEAIEIISKANSMFSNVFKLHIYGQISDDFIDEFFSNLSKNTLIEYRGIVEPNKSVNTLKTYDGLLFPTKYEGEGFPGTILDAFASGLPVIASNFKYNSELIKDNYNGFLFNTVEEAVKILSWIIENPKDYTTMKLNALKSYNKFSPENSLRILIKNLN